MNVENSLQANKVTSRRGKGVKCVLPGNCGSNVYEALSAAGIGALRGYSGAVRAAVERFKDRQPNTACQPNVTSHSGMADPASSSASQSAPSQLRPTPGGRTGMGMDRAPGGGGIRRGMRQGLRQGRRRGGGGIEQARGRSRSMGNEAIFTRVLARCR